MANFGQPIFGESVSQVTASPSVALGTRRMDSAGNEYIYGYNACNSLVEVGVPVLFNGGTAQSYSFTITNAASQAGWIAAVNHHATVPTAYYGWFMVKGLSRVVPDASQTSMNAGVQIVAGIDGGFVAKAAAVDGSGITSVGNTFIAGYGLTVNSIVTGYGSNASFTSAGLNSYGKAWIRTMLG